VVTKIIKHAEDARNATGLLLGLDLEGTLEVSNAFSLPHAPADEDEKSTKTVGASAPLPRPSEPS
jgi:translation initiation factor 3 subunit H